jgi:TolB protein
MKYKILTGSLASLLLLLASGASAAEGPILIHGEVGAPIPISVSGFTGEAASALKFDLEVMGFVVTGPESAQYAVSGSNNGNVQGRLSAGKSPLFAKSYTGASLRAQTHRFADDIVQKISGVKGIAETKIAFKAEHGPNGEIYIADYDGHNAQMVTRDNTIVAAPCWVPGRLALYYTSYKQGNPDIFYHNLSTGERRAIARYSGLNTSAAVSPDGRRVAMILSKAGSPDVFVCDADGSNLKQLTFTKEDESSPCWSPDGETICFASRVGGRAALYTVPASGGQMKRLVTSGVSNTTEPDWSPDGQTIIFTAQMGNFNICTVPARGGTASVLAEGEDPCWAPNSRTAIFCRRDRTGNDALSLLDVPTKQVKTISRISGSNSQSQPSWAR